MYSGVRKAEARSARFIGERKGEGKVPAEGGTAIKKVDRDIGVRSSDCEVSFREPTVYAVKAGGARHAGSGARDKVISV